MKKYIFTESQIKKIIDSQINEQSMGSVKMNGKLLDMNYENTTPQAISNIKTNGVTVFKVDNTGSGIMINDKPATIGQIIKPEFKITVPMSSYLYVTYIGEKGKTTGSISLGQDKLLFSGYVA